MRAWLALLAGFVIALPSHAQKTASFPTEDGGVIFADIYGHGDNAVVLAHGGQFNKESWGPQARTLAAAGFRVLALDFRGFGNSRGPGQADPLAAPLYLDSGRRPLSAPARSQNRLRRRSQHGSRSRR